MSFCECQLTAGLEGINRPEGRNLGRRYLAVDDEILGVDRPDVMAQCGFGFYRHVSDADTVEDGPSHARNVWHTV